MKWAVPGRDGMGGVVGRGGRDVGGMEWVALVVRWAASGGRVVPQGRVAVR